MKFYDTKCLYMQLWIHSAKYFHRKLNSPGKGVKQCIIKKLFIPKTHKDSYQKITLNSKIQGG